MTPVRASSCVSAAWPALSLPETDRKDNKDNKAGLNGRTPGRCARALGKSACEGGKRGRCGCPSGSREQEAGLLLAMTLRVPS